MPFGFCTLGRRPAFELMEPRLLLAANGLPAVDSVGDTLPDVVIHLPGSIAGNVFAVREIGGGTPADGAPISGVRLELLNEAGDVLAEAITDSGGAYEFPALAAGVYGVRQLQPAGMQEGAVSIGSGGGAAITASFVSEIVVEPGAMLRGYDFMELLELLATEAAPAATPALSGFVPPLVVSWSRPLVLQPEEVIWPVPIAPMPKLLAEAPRTEPVFGGSSGVIEEESVNEAFSDAEFVERIAEAAQSREDGKAEERVAMKRRDSRARDKAFEVGAEQGHDGADAAEAPAASDPRQMHRDVSRERVIVRKPAA